MKRQKLMKRAFALLLTVVMLLGLSSAVFASETNQVSEVNPVWPGWDSAKDRGSLQVVKTAEDGTTKLEGAKYVLYKVADINVSSSSGQISYSPTTSVAVNSSTTAAQFTEAVLSAAGLTPIEGVNTDATAGNKTGTDGVLNFTDLNFGVYLVKETVTPEGVTASHDFLISIPMSVPDTDDMDGDGNTTEQTWIKEITATPKNAVFDGDIEKTVDTSASSNVVVDAGGNNTIDIGANLSYKIEVDMPSDFYGGTNAKTYTQFDIFDKADAALTVDTSTIKVTIDGTEVKEASAAGANPMGYKLDAGTSGEFTISLVNQNTSTNPSTYAPYYTGLSAGSKVVVTYNAFVNTSATPGVAINNDAEINYQYDGGNPGIKEPGPEPEIYTYSHAILKVNDNDAALGHDDDVAANIKAGAKFVVKNADNKYLHYNKGANDADAADDYWEWVALQADATVFESGFAAPLATAKDGYIELIGLADGTYTLIEIEAPEGYSLLKAPVSIDVDDASTVTQKNGSYTTKIVNVAGFTLPGTGGAGIYIFIVAGIALIGAALVLYGKTRRSKKDKMAS